MSVLLDRPKAADLGVQVADAAEALRLLVAGDQVTTFNEVGEQYEVHLRAEEGNRGSQDAIAALPVPSSRLGIVTLDNIATFARERFAGDDQPHGPPAPGDAERQHAAGHVAGQRRRRRSPPRRPS